MMSKMLEGLKQLRMEIQKIIKHLNRKQSAEHESSKREELADLSCLKCIIKYMDPNKRITLAYYFPKFRILEKSVPLRLGHLTISENTIQIDDYTFHKFNVKNRRDHGFDRLYPISCFFGNNGYDRKMVDAILKTAFILFADRNQFQVGIFWSKIKIPFQLNIHVGTVLIAPKEGKHAKNVFNAIEMVNCVAIKELNSSYDVKYDWITHVKRFEMLTADSPDFLTHFFSAYSKTMSIYFEKDTIGCEDVILVWSSFPSDRNYVGFKLLIAISEPRADAIINRIFNSPRLREFGFAPVSEKMLHNPHRGNRGFELTIKIKSSRCQNDWEDEEDTKFADGFSTEFVRNARFHRYLCVEVVSSFD